MIGVIADTKRHAVVRELFELFKTPWEFYRTGRRYEVLLCVGDFQFDADVRLVLLYAGSRTRFDDERKIQSALPGKKKYVVSRQGDRVPIYDDLLTFPEQADGLLTDEDSGQCAAFIDQREDRTLVRIGYDLFGEVLRLLEIGQPAANADLPSLELHIVFLRDLITGSGVPLVEIPPVPNGYRFIACLTHDIDHPSIRQHKWDHTTFGFLRRALFGSLHNLLRGRLGVRGVLANWAAVLKLPFVHLGLAKDFWLDFPGRYLKMEQGIHSTFFVIPFKGRPGTNVGRPSASLRAARYGAQDIAGTIQELMAAGCEIGLHGIDAWHDDARGREELKEIQRLTPAPEIGVRMHWLCFDGHSYSVIEKAGAAYDSTVGYNETVGYHAGTTQAYKPLDVERLLELPLHVMDTAMFYPVYLGLSPGQAKTVLGRMADNASRFGGCLTINWHDRSLAPERLWGEIYRDLLQDLAKRGAWFGPAGQTVAWFRKRRSAVFEMDGTYPGAGRVRVTAEQAGNLPGLCLRIHKPRRSAAPEARTSEDYVDVPVDETAGCQVPCEIDR
jgi:peptidoglycan/xylan/chitin deacetylase (PgdA/CDA1 family)